MGLSYPGSEEAAERVQRAVGARVELRVLSGEVRRAAGAAMCRVGDRWWACAVVVGFPDFNVLGSAVAAAGEAQEYRPGLRAFFEGPALMRALEGLGERPEVLFVRGHGICHPRRCGLASHVGVELRWPAVGCAERLLCGCAEEPGAERGQWVPVVGEEGEWIGAAVRVQRGARPVYVSPGHLCDVESAVALTLQWAPRFRWPEPLRAARQVEVR